MSGAATIPSDCIVLRGVSKWYGEVLGLAHASLSISRGITSLVGPNGSGKSTLMNLVAGLLLPSKGEVEILGVPSHRPERLHEILGYCTQHDTFPAGFTGEQWLVSLLRIHAGGDALARRRASEALDRVGLAPDARRRRIGAYSKGMRQRLKLALAIAHDPKVLVLDEPLNGLDPLGRADVLGLFRDLAKEGRTLVLSSHILHEVNEISDAMLMLQHGYVVAEGAVQEVRSEIKHKPYRVRVTCDRPALLAARAFSLVEVVSAKVDDGAVIIEAFDAVAVGRLMGEIAVEGEAIHGIEVADESVQAVYDYLNRAEAEAK